MFITNHPYISTPHQTCVVVVAPIHWQEKIIAWAGAGIHVADVGGPVPGQISVGAQSIWEEALPMAPLKIVERGKIRKDIEQEYLLRSRTRIQNSIDLRAKIAANHTVRERLVEMATRYGMEAVQAAMEQALQYSETKLAGILESLPDGSWYHSHTLDYDDQDRSQTFVCRLKMTKQSGKLIFDFHGSSPQAGGVITRHTWRFSPPSCVCCWRFSATASGCVPGRFSRDADRERGGKLLSIALGRRAPAKAPRRQPTASWPPPPLASARCLRQASP